MTPLARSRSPRAAPRPHVVAVAALAAAWVAVNFLGAWREIALAKRVTDLGGQVRFHFDWSLPHFRVFSVQFSSDLTSEQWGVAADAMEQAAGVRRLAMIGVECDADVLRRFTGLARLRRLYLRGCHAIDDRAMPIVCQWRHLAVLDLGGTTITDAGLRDLERLAHLQRLVLPGRQRQSPGEPHWIFELRCRLIEHWEPAPTVTRSGIEMLARLLPGCEIRQVA